MSAFLNMGGYAATVWTPYGVTAAILIGLLVVSLRQASKRQQELDRLESQPDDSEQA
ncbi:MAG: heme exporter protein CcmD [Rhodospirillaceae bacterium]|nr:heme exporter protein CcmD [Rhodospirillaceae bacterium]|tara:strand:+ start:19201 stop:19371 length:171 start_codon:yes stop_codon:yes gene_type:complete